MFKVLVFLLTIFSVAANEVYLSDLDIGQISQSWSRPGKDLTVDGNPLTLKGNVFKKGIGGHAQFMAAVRLYGDATRFRAVIGVDDEVITQIASVEFVIRGDGQELYRSPVLKRGSEPLQLDLDVTGMQYLFLEINDAGDGNGSDHANWADAKITFNEKSPELVPVLDVTSIGIRPDSYFNSTEKVQALLEEARKRPGVMVVFPQGRYDFWPEYASEIRLFIPNNDDRFPHKTIFLMNQFKGLIIEGQGSDFIFHNQVTPFTVLDSEDVTIQHVNINWRRPMISQATIESIEDDSFQLRFLPESRYALKHNRLYMHGEGWGDRVREVLTVNKKSGRKTYRFTCGRGFKRNVSEVEVKQLEPGLLTLNASVEDAFDNGDVMLMKHLSSSNPGFNISNSSNVRLNKVNIQFAPGMGLVAQRSENITIENSSFAPAPGSPRYFSTYDDAIHLSGCRGDIKIRGNLMKNVGRDAVKVHGTYVPVIRKENPRCVRVRFMHGKSRGLSLAGVGDKVSLVSRATMQPYAELTVTHFKALNPWESVVMFKETLPDQMEMGDCLEVKSWNPNVELVNNRIENNYANGVTLNTAGKVVVKDNFFQTSGAPIIISCDNNYEFNSGPVRDVLIENNEFNNCLTSLYQSAHAQITIDPSIQGLNPEQPFHKNIRILNNTFHVFDHPILSAKSVDGLTFSHNTIDLNDDFKSYHYNPFPFYFEGSKAVTMEDNSMPDSFIKRGIKLKSMLPSEVSNKDEKMPLNE